MQKSETVDARWPSIEDLRLDLESTREFRRQRMLDNPRDPRNAKAVEICDRVMVDLDRIDTEGILKSYRDLIEELGDNADFHHAEAREYRSRLGFENDPANAEEYLGDLLTLRVRFIGAGN